ncbi:hypothetical protein D918_08141 [Trichuris suis]|nr:hypothetical protein D918_08141 [Trichuris suis]
MLPLHGDLYTSPSYGHVYAPPPPLRHNYRGPPASTPASGGPIITELTPSEYGSTVADVRRSSLEKEQQCYVRRLGHQRFYSPEQNSDSPRVTKARSWREVNDDVAARVTAASTDSPPIIPKRDYDEPTSYADRVRDESGQKCKRTMKAEPKESTPIVTCNGATMNRAVQLYKSPILSYNEAQRQNHLSKKCATVGCFADGNIFPPPTFLSDPLYQPPPSAPHTVNGFAAVKPTTGRYNYDPIGACLPIKEKRKDKSDPCLLFCCKDFTQLVWLIVGIILVGLVIGLILGLTLV